MTFQLELEQYEALVALARAGATAPGQLTELEQFLKSIETANGITRDFLWVQWQEAGTATPVGTTFPETWPPNLRRSIELVSRKIARVDVEQMLDQYANSPVSVLVTRDPEGIVGWTTLDDFFIT